MSVRPGRALAAGLVFGALGCSAAGCGGGESARPPAKAALDVRASGDRPPLVVVSRDGDPRGGLAAAVLTAGIDEDGDVAAALAGLFEARLRAAGRDDAAAVGSRSGVRVRLLAAGPGDAAAATTALLAALERPVQGDAAGLAGARHKLDALAKRARPSVVAAATALCTDALVPGVHTAARAASLAESELEAFRRSAVGLGRVTLAFAGEGAAAEGAATAVARGRSWSTVGRSNAAIGNGGTVTGRAPEGAAVTAGTLAVYTGHAGDAARAAALLGDVDGPFRARLAGLDGAPRLESVTATALPEGGCVAVNLAWTPRDLNGDGASRVASALSLGAQEAGIALEGARADEAFEGTLARLGGDPRDAAERAAWWRLSQRREGPPRSGTMVEWASAAKDTEGAERRIKELPAALERATTAWHEPVVEARTRVERGQGELWLLLASPCGTRSEAADDAGLSGLVALAGAQRAQTLLRSRGGQAEAILTQEAAGLMVHGAALPGENPLAHARRLADAAARAFAAEPFSADGTAAARTTAVLRLLGFEASPLVPALGPILAPNHPSWLLPWGTTETVGRLSHGAIVARATALRSGPLRVAVLANDDASQASVAVNAVDRWIARRPGAARACPAVQPATAPRPGTYSIEGRAGAAGRDVWVAAPLPDGDDARDAAEALAAALEGPAGFFAKALEGNGLVREATAQVLGAPRAPALVLHLTATGNVDGAVAQLRALLERLRQGAFTEADRGRALGFVAERALARDLDPRGRLLALFRGEAPRPPPSLETIRGVAATVLREETLVVVTTGARTP